MEQSRKDERKEQILNAALLVLVEKGYESSRIDDIVAKSSLSKGAIYWYYKSKKEIYLDLVNFWVLRYSAFLNHIVEKDALPSQQLQDLFQYFIDQYESNPEPFKVLAEFWSMVGKDEDFKDKLQTVYSNFQALVATIISAGVQSGEFKNVNIKITALSIMVNIESIIWFTLFDAHGVTAKEYMETIKEFILAGIIKKPS
ncbi:MAG: TetR/AcrR family transcriptional regulator [Candidatus Marinimicrobia bacterium]|jgi:AcrR family transcriptional regulator|nr:TetR/AcrR family transcriptional regulator [Candidatus Neomarinimicrobiota bacterium]MBT3496118.1 TetR/AcrR family transcriptional regulator [Candidatus Neomarinimicrobiota bacterium]MBT3691809.1 TetR/AcrR family transcriptional regulator [Candidatus Neomarinimicrobiota bacterium]MBT3732306.1 TetR/AcrR family transcriptional regulator [Candidatus Neomarinimicrobiota bacterium]MBT4144108.1 TetR/AcrR family transcriptional regulator [Candidatus Neomarinimicrobiota bacterium]